LGYNQSNYRDLIENIKRNLANSPARFKGSIEHGDLYEVRMMLEGPNGKKANVVTGWIIRPGSDLVQLVTIYIDKKRER